MSAGGLGGFDADHDENFQLEMQLQQSVLQALATAAQQASLDTKAAPAVDDSAHGAASTKNSSQPLAGSLTTNTEGPGDDQTGLQLADELALALGKQVCAATISNVARFLGLRTRAVCEDEHIQSLSQCQAAMQAGDDASSSALAALARSVKQTLAEECSTTLDNSALDCSRPRVAPHARRHTLLRRGTALARLGAPAAAMQCLTIARDHAQAVGDAHALAQAHLQLAHLEAQRNDYIAAVQYVQRAQQLGGHVGLWTQLLLAYADYRCARTTCLSCLRMRDRGHSYRVRLLAPILLESSQVNVGFDAGALRARACKTLWMRYKVAARCSCPLRPSRLQSRPRLGLTAACSRSNWPRCTLPACGRHRYVWRHSYICSAPGSANSCKVRAPMFQRGLLLHCAQSPRAVRRR